MPSDFLEKTLEEMVFFNQEEAINRGFPEFYKNTKNQFRLPSGKIIDIFSFEIIDDVFYCKIFELKRDQINIQTAYQAIGYGREVAKLTGSYYKSKDIQLYLVGSDMDTEFFNLSSWGANFHAYVYQYKIDGIKFEAMSSCNCCWYTQNPDEYGSDEINGASFRAFIADKNDSMKVA